MPKSEIQNAASLMGRKGGASVSAEKVKASKINGRLGGRPPKKKPS